LYCVMKVSFRIFSILSCFLLPQNGACLAGPSLSFSGSPNSPFLNSGPLKSTKDEAVMSGESSPKTISAKKLLALAGDLETRTKDMERKAKAGEPFTDQELADIVESLKLITPKGLSTEIELDSMRDVLKEIAHISHKDWAVTFKNSQALLPFLISDEAKGFPGPLSQVRYKRILEEGNWEGAVDKRSTTTANWAVLVTGCNGIRKTTSIYQEWFEKILEEALVPPASFDEKVFEAHDLPTGQNSFFRQLDHMIATLCNKDFAILYALTSEQLKGSENVDEPSKDLIKQYSNLKAAMFSRYRTLSELFGVLLLQQAQKKSINCLMETSGRDVAMFRYVDFVFGGTNYHKLALHFKINDLSQAQSSVDRRMVQEIQAGAALINSDSAGVDPSIDIEKVIFCNQGGPYGSEVLPGVQEASSLVWEKVLNGTAGVSDDWFKATIQINAHSTKDWTAQAVKPDGSLGTKYTFGRR